MKREGCLQERMPGCGHEPSPVAPGHPKARTVAVAKVKLSSEKSVLGNLTALQDLMTFPSACCVMSQNHTWVESHSQFKVDPPRSQRSSVAGWGEFLAKASRGTQSLEWPQGLPAATPPPPSRPSFLSHPQSKLSLQNMFIKPFMLTNIVNRNYGSYILCL